MAGTSRFIPAANNRAVKFRHTDTWPKLVNGDGAYAGAPPKVELASHLMANALTRDRATPWVTPANPSTGGSEVYLDLDFGSLRTVLGFGLNGYELTNPHGAAFPTQVFFGYHPSATTYSTGGFVFEWPALSLVGGGRDPFFLAPVGRQTRFARLWFDGAAFGDGFALGKPNLFDAIQDLGFLYSGFDAQRVDPEIVTEAGGPGGHPVVTKVARPWTRMTLQFARVKQATFDVLDGLAAARRAFVYLDHRDVAREVILEGGVLPFGQPYSPNADHYSVTLSLRQLP